MADHPSTVGAGGGRSSAGAVTEAVLEAVVAHPGIERDDLARQVRRETGVPIAAAITRIRSLERDGALIPAPEGGYELAHPAEAAASQTAASPSPSTPQPPSLDPVGAPAAEGPAPVEPAPPGRPAAAADEHELAAAIAEGDRLAMAAYRETREPAVYAYCSRVASIEALPAAVGASFARLAGDLRRAGPHGELRLDELLLQGTRVEAAERAPMPPPRGRPQPRRLLTALGLERRSPVCDAMPRVLAARATGLVTAQEAELVGRHLSRCNRCRRADVAQRRAERAYRARLAESPPAAVLGR